MKTYRMTDIKLPIGSDERSLLPLAAKKAGIPSEKIVSLDIYRRSPDLRHGRAQYVYSVDITVKDAALKGYAEVKKNGGPDFLKIGKNVQRPIVAGFGPAGMFCALALAEAGACPVVIERGEPVGKRTADVERFIASGTLDPESNILFGEGGAGTFSDGKLNTLLKEKNGTGRFVLSEFVKAGAPEEILYVNKPHIGTDKLREVIPKIREKIISLGGTVLFGTKLAGFEKNASGIISVTLEKDGKEEKMPCNALFLGIGHSARDTFSMLSAMGVLMEKKVFSVGVRVEHKQKSIDSVQYKDIKGIKLPPADYKLSARTSIGKTLYTFCMCPGGVVVPATNTPGSVVTNGMSDFSRGAENSNSALLVEIDPPETPEGVFGGIRFQEELERKAFEAGGGEYCAPCQLVGDFMKKQKSVSFGDVLPSYGRGTSFFDLSEIFPETVHEVIREGIAGMGRLFPGFDSPDAVLTAVESRSTSPVRVLRDDSRESSVHGIYPIGEGAGYAGGIMSSAIDGIRSAVFYINQNR